MASSLADRGLQKTLDEVPESRLHSFPSICALSLSPLSLPRHRSHIEPVTSGANSAAIRVYREVSCWEPHREYDDPARHVELFTFASTARESGNARHLIIPLYFLSPPSLFFFVWRRIVQIGKSRQRAKTLADRSVDNRVI